jgi:hypothetical protein
VGTIGCRNIILGEFSLFAVGVVVAGPDTWCVCFQCSPASMSRCRTRSQQGETRSGEDFSEKGRINLDALSFRIILPSLPRLGIISSATPRASYAIRTKDLESRHPLHRCISPRLAYSAPLPARQRVFIIDGQELPTSRDRLAYHVAFGLWALDMFGSTLHVFLVLYRIYRCAIISRIE